MKAWRSLLHRLFHWKSVLVIAALGNVAFGGSFFYAMFHDHSRQFDVYDKCGMAFFGFFLFLNVFAIVNVFFMDKLGIRLFLSLVFGFDAFVTGFMVLILAAMFYKEKDFNTALDHFLASLVLAVFILGVCSTLLAMRKLEPTDGDGSRDKFG